MSNARNLARLIVDSGGDVDVSSLGNVPPSNDASALTTGTLGTAQLPAGSVLQVATNYDNAAYGVGSSGTLSWGITITPKKSNSLFLIDFIIEWNSTNPNAALFCKRDGGHLNPSFSAASIFGTLGTGYGNYKDLDETPINTWNTFPERQLLWDTPNTLSTVTYIMGIVGNGGGDSIYTGRGVQNANYRVPSFRGVVMEIAQ